MEPHRLKSWDYSSNGFYFITICTHDMNHYFGKIRDGLLIPTPAALLAQIHWYEIPLHFEGITLHNFIVMPNHIHGIIQIDRSLPCTNSGNRGGATGNNNPMKTNDSIGAIIRSYKAIVTHEMHRHYSNRDFKWHTKFYDNIIRDDRAYQNISHYIRNNPGKWSDDRFNQ